LIELIDPRKVSAGFELDLVKAAGAEEPPAMSGCRGIGRRNPFLIFLA